MHLLDYLIFALYMLFVLGVGFYFYKKNKTKEDYYVGNRSISASHIGLSIVATDVGGGFSIGLGGLGFTMGLSGTWLLFTGLIGAWLTAVFMIPRIKTLDTKFRFLTFPDFLKHKYNEKVAVVAALISGIGYLGFTGGQVLAGAKLAAGTVFSDPPWNIDPLTFSIYVMAGIILLYTAMGGLKAVIYTDTIQWIILLFGLMFFAIPFSFFNIGGLEVIKDALSEMHFSLFNIKPSLFINWMVTIIPMWFIGMTIYQRIYACKNTREAQRAWYVAGVLEYPIIAFLGVSLGMMARVQFPQADPEMGIALLIRSALPIGVTGIVIAAYFSAIMSTADSCLIASSGNFLNDILQRYFMKSYSHQSIMRASQLLTFILGCITLIIASSFATVLEIILHAYSLMVGGLFVPTLGAYFWKKSDSTAALAAMITGGAFTLYLIFSNQAMPYNLDASFYGILVSLITFVSVSQYKFQIQKKQNIK